MYFMERRLKMKWLAVLFAVATVICSFGSGNMPQSNAIASGMKESFGLPPIHHAGSKEKEGVNKEEHESGEGVRIERGEQGAFACQREEGQAFVRRSK